MSKGGHVYRIRKITPARVRRMFLDNYIFSGVRSGISQAQIARQIEGIAGGDPEVLKTVPPKALESLVFPPNFTYSREAVRKRVREILKGVDKHELSEWRKVVNERCEESWMSLYPSIIKGDTDAINSGMRVIATQGRALGFWVDRAELTQKLEMPSEAVLTREMLDRLTDDELGTLDFLIQKMHGKFKDVKPAATPPNTLRPPPSNGTTDTGESI